MCLYVAKGPWSNNPWVCVHAGGRAGGPALFWRQLVVGYMKTQTLAQSGKKVFRWHGYLGLATYSLGGLAILLGAQEVR